MSGTEPIRPPRFATIGDCVRLWSHLTDDYIPDLKLELSIIYDREGSVGIRVLVCDYSKIEVHGDGGRSVWAYRDFFSPLYLISISQLFDLLISAHRCINGFFTTGNDTRPRL
jgi:hypothetical protein